MTKFSLEYEGQSIPVGDGEVTLGSGDGCTVPLSGEGVEASHAAVRKEGDGAVLRSNVPGEHDVRLNGKALYATELEPGDEVRFGELAFILKGGESGFQLVGDPGTHPLRAGLTNIGRSPDSTLVLDHNSVSREHAAVVVLPSGEVRLRDLGSSNGTYARGRRLGEHELQEGDQIVIGNRTLTVRAAAPASEGAGQPVASAGPAAASADPGKTVIGGAMAQPKLELQHAGKTRELKPGQLRIGRAPDCDVAFTDDTQVSRYHAQLSVSGTEAVLKDLGSANGTWLNGERLTSEQTLRDGDKIRIGQQELVFHAELPGADLGKTVMAQDLSGMAASGRTVVLPADAGAGGGAGASVAPPTDRASALAVLDLRPDADDALIERRYRELHSEFQVRLTNAPTPHLKTTYQNRLQEIAQAYQLLRPGAAAAAEATDLPSVEPVARPAGAKPAPPVEAEPAAAPATTKKKAAPAKEKATARKEKAASAGLPRSTMVLAILTVVAAVATGFCAIQALRAMGARDEAAAEFTAMQESVVQMEAAIPETEATLEALRAGKATLLENQQLKVCNLSSAPIYITWLHTTWVAEGGAFESYDSAYHDWRAWTIPPDGTFSSNHVIGDQVIWDGTAIFFAVNFDYQGDEYLRSAALPALDGGCYQLNLDE